jgi:serpin B
VLDEIRDGLERLHALARSPINFLAELGLAQRVVVSDQVELEPEYVQTLENSFSSGVERVTSRDPLAARSRVNAWVAQTTRGLIPELVPADGMNETFGAMLLSALYHRAAWKERFMDARPGNFSLPDGRRIQTPIMYRRGYVRYSRSPGVVVLELAYTAPGYTFVVLLPPDGRPLESLEQDLSAYSLLTWPAFLATDRLDLYFPKYTLGPGYHLRLKPALMELGMRQAFDRRADLTRMSAGRKLLVEDVYHDATIRVDEQGTTAAAAAGTHVVPVSARENQFKVDRPFLFFVREEQSGLILLFGRVVDPRATGGR